MIYRVTATTPNGNLTVEVEGTSKFRCLDLAEHYFRAAFGENVELWWKEIKEEDSWTQQR